MALPEYNRTVLRQVQQADMASARVWETLANTLDNFSNQAAGVARTAIAKKNQEAATAKADYRWQLGQDQAQAARDLTAEKYAKSQADAKAARDLAAEKYKKSQSDKDKALLLAAEKYLKAQQDKVTALKLTADKYAKSQQVEADKLARTNYVNSKEAEIFTELQKLSIKYENDYQGYISEAGSLRKAWLESEELDSVDGMRAAFTNLIDKKVQEYGVKPFENTQAIVKNESRTTAKKAIYSATSDAVFAGERWIESVYTEALDAILTPEVLEEQQKNANRSFIEMMQRFDDLVETHDFSAAEAIEFEQEITLSHLTGIMKGELKQQMKSGNGLQMIREFTLDPNKFMKKHPYLAALFLEGYEVSSDNRDEVGIALAKFWTDTNKENDYLESKAETQLTLEQANNYADWVLSAPDESSIDEIHAAYEAGNLDITQHNSLVDGIRSDKYYEEDALMKMKVQQMLFDPNSKQEDILEVINEAHILHDINWATYKDFMSQVRSGNLSDITTTPYFQTAMSNIAARLHPEGPMAAMAKGVADRISWARRELYNRVLNGEQPIMIEDEIVETWKDKEATWANIHQPLKDEILEDIDKDFESYVSKIDLTAGASYQDAVVSEDGWSTYYLGTAKDPDPIGTEMKIAKQFKEGLIKKEQAEKLTKEFRTFMKIHLGLKKI